MLRNCHVAIQELSLASALNRSFFDFFGSFLRVGINKNSPKPLNNVRVISAVWTQPIRVRMLFPMRWFIISFKQNFSIHDYLSPMWSSWNNPNNRVFVVPVKPFKKKKIILLINCSDTSIPHVQTDILNLLTGLRHYVNLNPLQFIYCDVSCVF